VDAVPPAASSGDGGVAAVTAPTSKPGPSSSTLIRQTWVDRHVDLVLVVITGMVEDVGAGLRERQDDLLDPAAGRARRGGRPPAAHSDGLIERRGAAMDAGLQALRDVVRTGPADPRAVLDEVVAVLNPPGTDDVTLVALART
jgi:hypothetical protein